MIRVARRPRLQLVAVAAAAAALALGACAAVQANRRAPASMAGGNLTPGRPPAASYGLDASRTCPGGGVNAATELQVQLQAQAAQVPPAPADGRVCAVAEALIGWREKETPRAEVRVFLARYFGLVGTPDAIFATFETEDPRQIGERLAETVVRFSKQVPGARWGVVSERASKDRTRVVLVLLPEQVELDAVPRRLEAGQKATVSGKLAGELENPQVLTSDVTGKLTTGSKQSGKVFEAEVTCGDRPGLLQVEVRAEQAGKERGVAAFPIACGVPLETTVALAAPPQPAEPAAQAQRVFEQVNAARTAAGLPALKWQQGVADVARAVAERTRDGSPPKDLAQQLKEAEVSTTFVVQNAAGSQTADQASRLILESPTHRANVMNADVTDGGVGVAIGKDPSGQPIAYVVELFVKELPPADLAKITAQLRDAITKRRQAYKLPTAADPALDALAEQYVRAVAAGGGQAPAAKEQLVAALNKGYKNVEVVLGAKADPLDLAEESNVSGKGKQLGIGAAQGRHPTLGKNAVWVVILLGAKR